MKSFEISSNVEWDCPPSYYITDEDFYKAKRQEVMEALKTIEADYAVFWWYHEHQDASLLVVADEETDIEVNGEFVRPAEDDDFEIRWEGPNLKIYKDGAVQLFWESKHTDDKCWCYIE